MKFVAYSHITRLSSSRVVQLVERDHLPLLVLVWARCTHPLHRQPAYHRAHCALRRPHAPRGVPPIPPAQALRGLPLWTVSLHSG